MEKETKNIIIVVGVIVSIGFIGHLNNNSEPNATDNKVEVADINYKESNIPVKTCDLDEIRKIDEEEQLQIMSRDEECKICESLTHRLGTNPNYAQLFSLFQAVEVFRSIGCKDNFDEIAYQLLNIVEARGQLNKTKLANQTYDIVLKIYEVSDHHVTPRDVNIALRQTGYAETMLDNDLILLGILLQKEKKDNGG